MLIELKVKNLGIIGDMDWQLDAGFNVITGETGAGKSLIIDAIELLLTGSAGEDVIRTGATEAEIEGVFSLSPGDRYKSLKSFLLDKGFSLDNDVLIINCEIRKGKMGIIRINGHTATKSVLRHIGQLLIDIHGQSQHLSLLDKKYHLEFLDIFAHTLEMRAAFSTGVTKLQQIDADLHQLAGQEQDRLRQEDFLRYQIDEIRNANLFPGEDIQLEEKRRLISINEKLREFANQVCQNLDDREFADDSSSAISRLNQAAVALKKLVDLDSSLRPQLEVLEKSTYDLEEFARDMRSYVNKQDNDPQKLEEIESRWELVKNLKRKYGRSVEDILSYLEKIEKELTTLGEFEEQQTHLLRERDKIKKELGILAADLSARRSQAADQLADDVLKELSEMEMGQMKFKVSISKTQSPEGLAVGKGEYYVFGIDGIDEVEFMVSTNPGEPLKPLAKIASTGEVSRFTLALKGALSGADDIPVLVFDEIDIGVGGRSGDVLGRKLQRLASNHQVICVTHLAQIASYADSHFSVTKKTMDQSTASSLTLLEGNPRLIELALMLAGPDPSSTALENAAELMKKADDWKKSCNNVISNPGQLSF